MPELGKLKKKIFTLYSNIIIHLFFQEFIFLARVWYKESKNKNKRETMIC